LEAASLASITAIACPMSNACLFPVLARVNNSKRDPMDGAGSSAAMSMGAAQIEKLESLEIPTIHTTLGGAEEGTIQ
jgi:hypothetical protein